jgi:pyridoxine/pyridoxamine 5'-phosphate oxidase
MTPNVFRDGIPSSRMMLLKSFGDPAHGGGGFVFFTNYKVTIKVLTHF